MLVPESIYTTINYIFPLFEINNLRINNKELTVEKIISEYMKTWFGFIIGSLKNMTIVFEFLDRTGSITWLLLKTAT